MEIDYNNAACATLVKSLSAMDILQKFRNVFLKEHLRKAVVAICTCFIVMTLHSSSHQRCSIKMAILKNSVTFTGKHLCQKLFLIKLQACNFTKNSLQLRCFPVNVVKERIQHPVNYLRCFCKKLLVRCLTVQNTYLEKKLLRFYNFFIA